MQDVVAVPANEKLVESIGHFLSAMEKDLPGAADQYIAMVDQLTESLIHLFLLEPADMVKLGGSKRRVVDFASATAGKASHLLTRQIYRKASNRELAPIAANVRELYWPADEHNDHHPRVSYPVSSDYAAEFRRAVEVCAESRGTTETPMISRVMDELSEGIIENFFVRNSREVKMGFVTRKALDTSVDTTRKAVRAVNHKVIGDLDDNGLKHFMGMHSNLVARRPASA